MRDGEKWNPAEVHFLQARSNAEQAVEGEMPALVGPEACGAAKEEFDRPDRTTAFFLGRAFLPRRVLRVASFSAALSIPPALRRDRALTNRIRVVPDAALLRADRLIVRDDLASNTFVRFGKDVYEGLLRGYWTLLQHTVLAGARHAVYR